MRGEGGKRAAPRCSEPRGRRCGTCACPCFPRPAGGAAGGHARGSARPAPVPPRAAASALSHYLQRRRKKMRRRRRRRKSGTVVAAAFGGRAGRPAARAAPTLSGPARPASARGCYPGAAAGWRRGRGKRERRSVGKRGRTGRGGAAGGRRGTAGGGRDCFARRHGRARRHSPGHRFDNRLYTTARRSAQTLQGAFALQSLPPAGGLQRGVGGRGSGGWRRWEEGSAHRLAGGQRGLRASGG